MEGLREFLLETQVRLGVVEWPGERLFWAVVRDVWMILHSRRRLVGAFMVLALISVPLRAQGYSPYDTSGSSASFGDIEGAGTPTFDVGNIILT
jgi:hypothetical protein